MTKKVIIHALLSLLFAAPGMVLAGDDSLSSGNTAWILTSTALVLFMTLPGLSLFYGGLVRVKSVLSVLMQCFSITCLVSVLWLIGVYSLAFSEGNAFIGGPGTITPASGFVGPAGGLFIGIAAGFLCFNAASYMQQRLPIDDSLDVFPVHGVGGMLGTLLAAVFASAELGVFSGQGYNEGMTMRSQMGVQLTGILATVAYTAVVTFLLIKLVDVLLGLRVSKVWI